MVCQPIQREAARILHEIHVTEPSDTLYHLLIPAYSRNAFQRPKSASFCLADLEGQE